mmetsp:Transcript_104155/g.301317  ORF Transcript_104155/g.301317 Transcript_104155/m.301317 type:complete len:222 (+) Transcript_104155:350-1015(+)
MSACTKAVASCARTASASDFSATIISQWLSASSMILFSTPASWACLITVFSTVSSSPFIASSNACVSSRIFFPAADTFREAFSARVSFWSAGLFCSKSCCNCLTLYARCSGNAVSWPRWKARMSARPTWWKLSQSRIKPLLALSHVGMWPTTTQSRLARDRATFKRRQSATKPTSPRWLARTKLKMITSLSLPWKASTVEICVATFADCGSQLLISRTCAP